MTDQERIKELEQKIEEMEEIIVNLKVQALKDCIIIFKGPCQFSQPQVPCITLTGSWQNYRKHSLDNVYN